MGFYVGPKNVIFSFFRVILLPESFYLFSDTYILKPFICFNTSIKFKHFLISRPVDIELLRDALSSKSTSMAKEKFGPD